MNPKALQQIALEEAFGAFERGLASIVNSIIRERLRREAEPELWRRFHSIMLRLLPRWRWLARAHHRRMARRYEALAGANCLAAICQVCPE